MEKRLEAGMNGNSVINFGKSSRQELVLAWAILVYRNNLGEGEGTPLQYPCLENPMDGGAWWAAVYGVAQSRTRLK